MVFAVPLLASDITHFQTEPTHFTQSADVGFAARAPPLAVPNVAGAENEAARRAYAQNRAELVGAALGYITSGGTAANVSQGGATARSALAYNRQLHIREAELIERYAADFAVEQGYCSSTAACDLAAVQMAEAELTAETLRGVSDDFAYLEKNTKARVFLDGLAGAGTKVAGQTLFGVLDRSGSEYLNSTLNMGDLGTTYASYHLLDQARLVSGNAVYTAAAGAYYDLLRYEGSYERHDFVGYLQANAGWSKQYLAESQRMFSDSGFQDRLLASDGYETFADIRAASSDFEGVGTGLLVLNGNSVQLGVQAGVVTLNDLLGNGINADGTANEITKAFGYNLQGVGMAGLAGALATRVGGIPRAGVDRANAAEKITWVDESANMSLRARVYDDGAIGSRSNIETHNGQAPALARITPDGQRTTVRFDGVDGNVLIDRKLSVVTTPKAKNQALRQSEALEQNGLTARWGVPTQAQAIRALRVFEELGINNITVRVISE